MDAFSTVMRYGIRDENCVVLIVLVKFSRIAISSSSNRIAQIISEKRLFINVLLFSPVYLAHSFL